MKHIALAVALILSCAAAAAAADAPAAPFPQTASSGVPMTAGRYQLVVVPGHAGSPFLLDSASGCLWHQIYSDETKRSTFVEVDVENLHWGWGTGAQQLLAGRIDGANVTDEQKRVMKESLQKTTCGLSSVVLTPGPRPSQGQSKPSGQ